MARPIFLLVLTPRAIASDYVRREVALALRETVPAINTGVLSLEELEAEIMKVRVKR